MAIPSQPQNFYVQQANGKILCSWDLSAGATSYIVQRSLDNVTYTTLATVSGSPLATSYLDTSCALGTQYYYQVAASNTSGTSTYTTPQSEVPAITGEKTLGQIRLAAQQRADRVNSNFVTKPEWNSFINQSMFELYDLLVTLYEDLYIATPVSFVSDGTTFLYPLPDGVTTFTNSLTQTTFVAPPFYKLVGMDLGLNLNNRAWVTLNKFQFAERNDYIFPNTNSAIYGVFNSRYRLMGNKIEFIPTPTANQIFQVWYIPRITELLQDTDTTTVGISGWIDYVITKAAYYALTKEESDTTSLVMQLAALQKRIEESASNRDAGLPDKISNTRRGMGSGWDSGSGFNGPLGGW